MLTLLFHFLVVVSVAVAQKNGGGAGQRRSGGSIIIIIVVIVLLFTVVPCFLYKKYYVPSTKYKEAVAAACDAPLVTPSISELPPSGPWRIQSRFAGHRQVYEGTCNIAFAQEGTFVGTGEDDRGPLLICGKFVTPEGGFVWVGVTLGANGGPEFSPGMSMQDYFQKVKSSIPAMAVSTKVPVVTCKGTWNKGACKIDGHWKRSYTSGAVVLEPSMQPV